MINFKRIGIGLFAVLLFCNNASATLIGDEIDIDLVGGINLQDLDVLVGAGPEIIGGDASTNFGAFLFDTESIDIGATTIEMMFDTSLGENAMLTFGDLDFGSGIGAVALTSSIGTVTQGDVSFTSNSVTLDFTDWFSAGGNATFLLELREVEVFEPTTLALMGLGLAGVGFSRRKTR